MHADEIADIGTPVEIRTLKKRRGTLPPAAVPIWMKRPLFASSTGRKALTGATLSEESEMGLSHRIGAQSYFIGKSRTTSPKRLVSGGLHSTGLSERT